MSGIVVRQANDLDATDLIRALSNDISGSHPNNPVQDIPGTLRCPAARIFVAQRGQEIVGTLTASWNGRNGELRYFWIAPSLRRTRTMETIFNKLLSEAVTYLRSTGMRRVLFFVRRGEDSIKQIRMYSRKLKAHTVDPIVMALHLDNELTAEGSDS